jgi:hypothetical protein
MHQQIYFGPMNPAPTRTLQRKRKKRAKGGRRLRFRWPAFCRGRLRRSGLRRRLHHASLRFNQTRQSEIVLLLLKRLAVLVRAEFAIGQLPQQRYSLSALKATHERSEDLPWIIVGRLSR